MSQDLLFRFPIEVMLALVLVLAAVGRVLIALHKPAPVRMPGRHRGAAHGAQAPYKLEVPDLLRPGQLDVVPQAGREPANR